MNVCVIGHGHFASIVAVVLAKCRHSVAQSDEMPPLRRESQIAPADEPGYRELADVMRARGRLVDALPYVDVYWIAYDVPLDVSGRPVVHEVGRRIIALDRRVPEGIPFIVSCQWPVGTCGDIERQCPRRRFYYVLENVRAGKALKDFFEQDVIIVGTRNERNVDVARLLSSLQPRQVLTMSPESAELSKHALNAFMALQIAFINEIAHVAARIAAHPSDVSRALLSDRRVSDSAPLHPGAPFGGGSLQRDLMVLEGLTDGPIIHAIRQSNDSRS